MTVLSDRVDALEATNANLVAILSGLQATLQAAADSGQGPQGWSPELAVVTDGARRVFQVTDWVGGGTGTTKPATGYVGAAGLVETAAEAIDIRGGTGATGASAYQAWLDLGNTGGEQDFLNDISAGAITATAANVTAAEAAQTKAEEWAEAAEDIEVEIGQYSALHHAAKAAASSTAAEVSATAAETARAATETLFEQFGDQYLGPFAADPTLDNSGNALTEGDIYFNTVDEVMKFYSGSAWVAPESIATTAATGAQAAQTAAETAQGAAEVAEAGAVAAQGAAQAAQTAAETAETNATSAATAAEGYRDTTQTLRDAVLERFIGNYADDAAANASGFTIGEGIVYWNTTTKTFRVYNGTAWSTAVLDTGGAMLAATYDPQAIADDAFDRGNHTGAQAISTVTGLQTALNGKAAATHTHTLANVTDAGAMAALAEATADQVRGLNTGALGITTRRARDAAALITPSGAADWTPDWAAFVSADWNVTANRTLGNPTNVIPGTTRVVKIRASDATARTISWASNYKGNIPTATVTNAAFLFCTLTAISSTEIIVSHLEYS